MFQLEKKNNDEMKINVLDADLGLEMIQEVFSSLGMGNVQLKEDVPITPQEAEHLLSNVSSYDTEMVLDWFLNEYLAKEWE